MQKRRRPLSISNGLYSRFFVSAYPPYPATKRIQDDPDEPTEYRMFFMFEHGDCRPASDFFRMYLRVSITLVRVWDPLTEEDADSICEFSLITEPFVQDDITWANQPTSKVAVASATWTGPSWIVAQTVNVQYFKALQDLGYPVYGVVAKGNIVQTVGDPYPHEFEDTAQSFDGVLIE